MIESERQAALQRASDIKQKVGTSDWDGRQSLGSGLDSYRAKQIRLGLERAEKVLRNPGIQNQEYVDAFSLMFDQGVGRNRSLMFMQTGGMTQIAPLGHLIDGNHQESLRAIHSGTYDELHERRIKEIYKDVKADPAEGV